MGTIMAWLSAHPILAWVIFGLNVLVALIIVLWLAVWLLAHLVFLLQLKLRRDRSGANLGNAVFTVRHDDASDEVIFSWVLTNHGKFAARRVRIGTSCHARQTNGQVASWRLNKELAELAPGDSVEIAIRVALSELSRQAHDFDNGSVAFWCNYSSASPKKPATGFVAFVPRQRFALTVGQIGGQDSLTVTDLTPISEYEHLRRQH